MLNAQNDGIQQYSAAMSFSAKMIGGQNGIESNNIGINNNGNIANGNLCCRVCGADGGGKHYGSICCSGCKGFFRRSVRFQKLYNCPYGQKCAISKMYRNCCRACRYKKCLQVGLDPNLVQSDWGKSGQSKGKCPKSKLMKAEVKEEPIDEEEAGKSDEEMMLKMVTNGVRQELNSQGEQIDGNGNCSGSNGASPLVWHNRSLHAESIGQCALGQIGHLSGQSSADLNEAIALADYLVRVEHYCDFFTDRPSNGGIDHPLNYSWDLNVPLEMAFRQPGLVARRAPIGFENKKLEQGGQVFAGLFCRLVVHIFDWASHLPELMELSEEDRFLLLKKRTMRSMWWMLAQRSAKFDCGPQGMVVGGEMFYPRDPGMQSKLDPGIRGLLTDACNMSYDELIQPMRLQQISEAESALLRAIAFFSPVARLSAEGHRLVLSFQNKFLNALTELVMRREENNGGQRGSKGPMERMGRMMMMLTALEQIVRISDDALSMFCTFNMNEMRGQLNYELHMGGH